MADGFDLSELSRRLENLLRIGTVAQADYGAARVRVKSGDLLTGWLPWLTHRASNDVTWHAPEVGEQVLLLCPSGDPALGVALPAVYQAAHPAPADEPTVHRTVYQDGTVTEYDRAAHRLTASVRGDVVLIADGDLTATIGETATLQAGISATVKAPQINFRGNMSATGHTGGAGTENKTVNTFHTGNYTLTGNVVVEGSITLTGDLQVNGNVNATGTVIDGGGNTAHHSH